VEFGAVHCTRVTLTEETCQNTKNKPDVSMFRRDIWLHYALPYLEKKSEAQ